MNIHQHTFQTPHYDRDEEIDLLEIAAILWRRKILIVSCVLLCVLPTFVWLTLQAPIYKLETLFGSTTNYDIQALQPTHLPDGARYEVSPLKSEDFYQDLLVQAGSLSTQKVFWEQLSKQPLSIDPTSGSSENDVEFKRFFRSLTITPPNPKTPNITISQINMETPDPKRDTQTLTAYVNFLNTHVVDKFVSQLEKGYSSNLQQLESDYTSLKKREQQKLGDSLLQLQESLNLARSLNIIDTPYEQLSGIELKVVDDRQYLLGTRVLTQEIKSLQERAEKPLSAFVPELRNMEYWREIMLKDVARLNTIKSDIQAFNLASPVVSSLDPIKPKKLLILVAVTIAAVIIGVLIALVANGIKSYQARSRKEI